jgi:hypothetical protein
MTLILYTFEVVDKSQEAVEYFTPLRLKCCIKAGQADHLLDTDLHICWSSLQLHLAIVYVAGMARVM